jgi:hypothetical protein
MWYITRYERLVLICEIRVIPFVLKTASINEPVMLGQVEVNSGGYHFRRRKPTLTAPARDGLGAHAVRSEFWRH